MTSGSDWQDVSQRRRTALTKLCLSVCALAAAGCSDAVDHSDCGSVYGGETSLTTWWRPVVTEEGQAQQSLVDGYLRCSGGAVTVESVPNDKEKTLLLYEQQDRHLLLVNGLTDIDRLECTAQRGNGLFALKDMDGLRWNDRIPALLQPYVRPCFGERTNRLFAIPVGLHTLNRTLVNRRFAEQFTTPDLSLDGFVAALERTAAELQAKPIVIQKNVSKSYLLIENMMVAVAGPQYRDFWNLSRRTQSQADIDMKPFEDTLDYAERLLPYIEFVDGDDAAVMERVCSGKAALTVSADWIDPNNYCGDQLESAPFPGTAQYDVFAFDAFAVDYSTTAADTETGRFLPKHAAEYAWLKAVTSVDVQADYARLKRSRPLVKADSAGNTVALRDDELFAPGVTPLPGLLLVVEHSSFVGFSERIDDYFATPRTDPEAVTISRQGLTTYVIEQLCLATSCKPVPTPT